MRDVGNLKYTDLFIRVFNKLPHMGTTHYGDFFAEKRKKQVATITDNYFLVMDCSHSDKIYNNKKNVFKVSLVGISSVFFVQGFC